MQRQLVRNRPRTPCNGWRPLQWWRQNWILPQRRWKQSSWKALALLENTSLSSGEGEIKGIWLPSASLTLFCYMSNTKTLLYLQTFSLCFRAGTWAVTGRGLSWICSSMAPAGTGEVVQTESHKSSVYPCFDSNDSWLTFLCLKGAEFWAITKKCYSWAGRSIWKTWYTHGMKSLCWQLMLDHFCKCLSILHIKD